MEHINNATKMFFVLFLGISLVSCSKKTTRQYFYIPSNYEGWVNIIFNDSTSKNEGVSFEDGMVYFIHSRPDSFLVKNAPPEEGWYDDHFYYYDANGLERLPVLGANPKIFAPQRLVVEKNGKRLVAFSFFVSHDSIRGKKGQDELNPLQK